jgi:hypothetical protein
MRKKSAKHKFKYYWPTVPGQYCLLAEGDTLRHYKWRTEHKKSLGEPKIDEKKFI